MKLSLTFHLRRNFRRVEDKKSRRWDAGGQVWGVTRALGTRLHLFFVAYSEKSYFTAKRK